MFRFHQCVRQAFAVMLMLILLFFGCNAYAQEQRVITYSVGSIPPALILNRGDVLEIEGPPEKNGAPQTFMLRAADETHDQGTFTGRWRLREDTVREHYPAYTVTILQTLNNGDRVSVAHVHIRIVEKPILEFASPSPDARITAPTPLRIRNTTNDADDRVERIGYTLDDKPLGLFTNGTEDTLWDPVALPFGLHNLGATARMRDGSLYRLKPIQIVITEKLRALPFACGTIVDLSALNGEIPIRAYIAPSIRPSHVQYLVDSKSVAQQNAPPFDSALWNPASATTGKHKLQIELQTAEGTVLRSSPLDFEVYRKLSRSASTEAPHTPPGTLDVKPLTTSTASIESLLLAKKTVTYQTTKIPPRISALAGTEIDLTGEFDLPGCQLVVEVDAAHQGGFAGRGRYRLPVNTSAIDPGLHDMRIEINNLDGHRKLLARCQLAVFTDPPLHINIPSGTEAILKPIQLTMQAAPELAPKLVAYFVDGHVLPTDPEMPLTAFWDPRGQHPGTYTFSAQVTDTDGTTFHSPDVKMIVPTRIAITDVPAKIDVTQTGQTVPLKFRALEGLQLTAARYELDGNLIVTQDKPPFDSVEWNVEQLTPGPHDLVAQITDISGANYVSLPFHIEVTNAVYAEARAKADAKLQNRLKALNTTKNTKQSTQKGNTTPIVRKRITALPYQVAQRDGEIGRIKGLALLALNGRPVMGKTIEIEASLTPGTGQERFLGLAKQSTLAAGKAAVAYSKQKLTELKYPIDWTAEDIMIRHDTRDVSIEGVSASVADAVALLSVALKMPVDSSAAVTGGVGSKGEVLGVGDVQMKLEAALNDPSIRTLIVPADQLQEEALVDLYIHHPERFLNRRIIAVHTMEEVLRQTLIGYNNAYDFTEELIQEGITSFAHKADKEAIEALEKARHLTPENLTISLWINLIRANSP